MSSNFITAVICTRNRAAFLKKCLKSILLQSAAEASYEILVVDNGSTDSTRDVVKEFESDKKVRYVHEPVAGLSRARNTGWREAHGQYVGYIDDDATVADSWIASILWVLKNVTPVPEWIGGPIELEWETPNPGWITGDLKVPLGFIDWGNEPRTIKCSERLGGGNSVYCKEVLKKIGGFDERLGRGVNNLLSGEETQLQKRIESLSGRLFYHPGVKIFHWVGKERVQPGWFYRRYYWGGISDYFMNRTLPLNYTDSGSGEQAVVAGNTQNRGLRIFGNLYNSIGLFSSMEKTIHSRIYVAYVLGVLVGFFRWKTGPEK